MLAANVPSQGVLSTISFSPLGRGANDFKENSLHQYGCAVLLGILRLRRRIRSDFAQDDSNKRFGRHRWGPWAARFAYRCSSKDRFTRSACNR